MKYFNLNAMFLLLAALIFSACDDDNENPVIQLESTEVSDLNSVSAKNYTFFNFKDNAVVPNADSATSKWDIGFRGTTIILNGGTSGPGQASGQIVGGIFDELKEAPDEGYQVDAAG